MAIIQQELYKPNGYFEELTEYYHYIGEKFKIGIEFLHKKHFFQLKENDNFITPYIGVVHKNHGLKSKIYIGNKYTESNVTNAIKSVFSKKDLYKKLIVEILLDSLGSDACSKDISDVIIKNEHTVENNKRMDLYFEFNNNLQRYYIVIEAKFDHFLDDYQLQAYSNYIEKNKDKKKCTFIFLTKEGQKPSKDHLKKNNKKRRPGKIPRIWKEYQPLSWFSFIRKVEEKTANIQDESLQYLKNIIWQKIN